MKTRNTPSTSQPPQSVPIPRPRKKSPHSPRRNLQPSYSLRRDLGFWRLTFEGREAILKHEQGLACVAWLLTHPPAEPIHGLRLALEIRAVYRNGADAADLIQQRNLGLDEAEAFRSLRRRQKQLEAQLEDRMISEPVKAELREELEAICEHRQRNPWHAEDNAQKCVRSVAMALNRLIKKLQAARDAQGRPHPVLRPFGSHLMECLMIPSGRGGAPGGPPTRPTALGCFTYEPPPGVSWSV